jgi:hypothetical protein
MENKKDLMPMSPEGYTVASAYIEKGTVQKAARLLNMLPQEVSRQLEDPKVKAYIDQAYLDSGYRNRVALGKVMDTIIDKKLEELEEAEIGSSKDILDILTMAHKMRMEEVKAMVEYEKLHKPAEIKNQTNVQINDSLGGGNYGRLMSQLMGEIIPEGK